MNTQPFFSLIDTQTYEAEFSALLQHNLKKIDELTHQSHYTWEGLIHPLDELSNTLHIKWALLSHLHHVLDHDDIRKTYNACLPLLTDYQSKVGQNKKLFEAYKQISNTTLSPEQRQVITHNLRAFHLSGVDLSKEDKIHFAELEQKLANLNTRFAENVTDATHAWHKIITDETMLQGLPPQVITYAKEQALQRNITGWVLTLEMPCYLAVMSYAEHRSLREEFYRAFVTRASDLDQAKFDNTQVMYEILSLRHQLAHLLELPNYAELSLVTKMLTKSQQVLDFLNELADLAVPLAKKEMETLKNYALITDGINNFEPWDTAYYSEKLQKHEFHFNSEELRPYFPEERVLKGLFELVEQLYNIHIKTINLPNWHKDVKSFVIYNAKQEPIAYFYIDLYAREKKQNGAWMDDLCSRYKKLNGELQLPIAFLTCNFTPPMGEQPSLLTHDEVLTLFHEFGHGLHHMLTQMEILDISGISGVEWDAVELPSQFMENFCWEKSVLDKISGHYLTGEPLPDALYKQLYASKNFQAAMQLARQIEFSLFDFYIHLEFTLAAKTDFIQEILNRVRKQVAVTPLASYNRFQHSFSHIFAGGYAAGYYSYKWAEVLSSDVYESFAEHGVISKEIGQQFLQHILSRGGSDDAMNLFKKFRGREPKLEALLRNSGLPCE